MKASSPLKRADQMFSRYVRDRDGGCVAGGTDETRCAGVLQCAHIHSRRYRALRWKDEGAIALCQAHHFRYTNAPLEWIDWCTANGIDWWALKRRALTDRPEKPAEALERMRRTG